MNSIQVKTRILESGADLCGIASVERFKECEKDFHPAAIYPAVKSVIVYAKRMPDSLFSSKSPIPYTTISDFVVTELIKTGYAASLFLQDQGVAALPVTSDIYEYWDEVKEEGKGILSLKHAGYLAGLGVISKNRLLTNRKFGNRILLGALLVNAVLDEDPVDNTDFCKKSCFLCINNCPSHALDEYPVNQKKCREKSGFTNKKGYFYYTCNKCRSICPYGRGFEKFECKK